MKLNYIKKRHKRKKNDNPDGTFYKYLWNNEWHNRNAYGGINGLKDAEPLEMYSRFQYCSVFSATSHIEKERKWKGWWASDVLDSKPSPYIIRAGQRIHLNRLSTCFAPCLFTLQTCMWPRNTVWDGDWRYVWLLVGLILQQGQRFQEIPPTIRHRASRVC